MPLMSPSSAPYTPLPNAQATFPPLSTTGKRLTIAAVYLGTLMASLAISLVTVALPAIQSALKVEFSGLQWVVGAYALCLSAFMLSAGPLSDRYGRKRVWLSGVALFIFGSAVCAAASSLPLLIAGCALQGMAGAVVIPGSLSILTQAFPDPRERAHVIGGWSSFSGVALIVGPLLGGLLVDHVSWRSIFLINLPLGAVTLAIGLWGVQESADPEHASFDPLGQVLSVLGLGGLTYALIDAGDAGWAAPSTVLALVIALVAFILFIVVELRVARPILPVALFRDRTFASVNFASFVLGFSGYSSLFLFSLFLQQVQGWSATQAGWRMTPVFIAMAASASQFGRLAHRHGMRRLMISGYVLLGLSMLALAWITPSTPYAIVACLFTVLGIGLGLSVPATGAAAMAAVPRAMSGTGSATMNALRQSGMTIGIALLGTLMSARALSTMTDGLAAIRIGDALALASIAVQRHEMPQGLALAPGVFKPMLADAFAQGFSSAAICAGLFGLLVPIALLAKARRSRPLITEDSPS
ncbi:MULTISPECIES: DHA2 family efflux MFS transporter permease subunit [unclassified Beijerinckia]|uniref:DHA2 family efflux MFS transporter permease subunit n=1 Tax=unclassified Beijerinckia TaxID=2638183 RepID=UPI0008975506|nr:MULTISPECIES: DHA2 family efflux MFS transporter permease subunit [unclassified Beijerinckia]MDH7796152.1 DHA2 family methylenomycin A resistance protein-like MFS transporter [Beijerinckia sp. GAS462]SEC32651.1 drug resistance transporter, EmrB/QacA subfamily [Beijerinckia sp. 28-YEA-48]